MFMFGKEAISLVSPTGRAAQERRRSTDVPFGRFRVAERWRHSDAASIAQAVARLDGELRYQI